MSMSAQENSGMARFARWALGCAVRYWPEENRAWGLALAAEIDETRSAFETVRWSFGGIMLFSRSVLSSTWKWMKLPAGSSLPEGLEPEQPGLLPKRSRLFTATVLACAAVLLFLPEGRVAVQTVTASWLAFMPTHSDERTLDKLAARAEKAKDAQTLAFVALSPTGEPTHEAEQRAEGLIARTVALDPSYIWIYGAKNHSADYYPAQKEWVERLQAADPDNAVPILIEASAVAEQKLKASPGYPTESNFRNLGNDPQWMALMARAYAAPKYDSYLAKHIRVMRDVWGRNPSLPPDIFLMGLWSHGIPDLRLMRLHAEIELDRAKRALAAGDAKQAETLAQGVAAFGARMMGSSGAVIEELIAVAISRMADKELAEIYTAEGKVEEARKATAHGDELEQFLRKRFRHDEAGRLTQVQAFQRQAALVQGAVILGGLALLCAVVGILSLELWRGKPAVEAGLWRRVVCFAADWAPMTLLVASGAFLVCFLPFQKVLADFRVSSFEPTDEMRINDAMWSLVKVPEHVLGVDAAVTFWSAVTIVLSVLLLFMLVRGFYRTRHTAANPA
jgi:hypothetical protein